MLFALFFGFSFAHAESQIVEQYTVNYEIDGGEVLSIGLDSDFIELIIDFDSTDDGILKFLSQENYWMQNLTMRMMSFLS